MKQKELSLADINKLLAEIQKILNNQTQLLHLENIILTDQDVCKILKISTKTLRRRCKNGGLRCYKIGGIYYFHKYEVYMYIIKSILKN
jgi:excisionase family DNA binding protein